MENIEMEYNQIMGFLADFEKDMDMSLIKAIKELMVKTGGNAQYVQPDMLPKATMLFSIIAGLDHLERKFGSIEKSSWKDNIADELMSAREKYEAYLKSNDATMLEMSRQELQHAAYYLNHAKMSPDMELRKKVPEYQKEYDQLAMKINAPHGSEKIGRL